MLLNRVWFLPLLSLKQGLQLRVSVWNRVYFLPILTLEQGHFLSGSPCTMQAVSACVPLHVYSMPIPMNSASGLEQGIYGHHFCLEWGRKIAQAPSGMPHTKLIVYSAPPPCPGKYPVYSTPGNNRSLDHEQRKPSGS